MKKSLPPILLYPFISAILPVVTAESAVRGGVYASQFVPIYIFALLFAGAAFWIFRVLAKDADKAAVLTTVTVPALFSFFVFQAVADAVCSAAGFTMPPLVTLAIFLSALAFIDYLIITSKAEFRSVATMANIGAIFLLLSTAYPIYVCESKMHAISPKLVADNLAQDKAIKLTLPKNPPDIYYIIMDAMASPYTLKEMYGYDNSAFIDYLRKKGFYVALHSVPNHDRTDMSIPSSLNFQFMNYMEPAVHADASLMVINFELFRYNRIADVLKKAGYKFVNVQSGYHPTDVMPTADINYSCGPGNSINTSCAWLTAYGPLEPYTLWLSGAFAQVRLCFFDHLAQIKAIPGPKFVFVHSLLTHPPFVFSADGKVSMVPKDVLNEPYTQKAKYLEQLKFAEKELEKAFDLLLADPKYRPIIILQSDHGPYSSLEDADTSKYQRERLRIINAYYLPDGGESGLYQTITPVNTFRYILNRYFGAGLPLLPDDCYMAVPRDQAYHLRKVNDEIQWPDEPPGGKSEKSAPAG